MLQFTDEQIQAIGEGLRLANNEASESQLRGVGLAAERLVDVLGNENPAFDRESFYELVYQTTVTRDQPTPLSR